ncbi:hypothetical protein SKAU_G00117900 [Synaphobranchus kaupii]|uniref:Uncharacterized protein n=1 Tax=Synaphobranchus kaupii TaxID=118154 RepID=A0A9Q1J150_SYNKA|nr:hypothetical protein SKAU_G00117900 [Synaphobranchus kaupii]
MAALTDGRSYRERWRGRGRQTGRWCRRGDQAEVWARTRSQARSDDGEALSVPVSLWRRSLTSGTCLDQPGQSARSDKNIHPTGAVSGKHRERPLNRNGETEPSQLRESTPAQPRAGPAHW